MLKKLLLLPGTHETEKETDAVYLKKTENRCNLDFILVDMAGNIFIEKLRKLYCIPCWCR